MVLKKITMAGILVIGIIALAIVSLRSLKLDIPFLALNKETVFENRDLIFSIGIVVGEGPFHLRETKSIGNPVLTAADVNDVDAAFVADPFMIRKKDRWYMFFEVLNRTSGHGDIGYAVSRDGMTWDYQQIVLDEPFHLSYPHVFFHDDTYYMIVESNAVNSIRLYKSDDFPKGWKYETTLLEGLHFTDSTIFLYNGRWWIFTETDPVGDGTLRLYHSTSLRGRWEEHPQSPIIDGDENIARPAGKVLFYRDRLYRVAQDCWPIYGNKVRIFQIDELTTTSYAERELCEYPEIEVEGLDANMKNPPWRFDGFHHLDLHQLDENKWIGVIDGWTNKSIFEQWVIKIRVPFTQKEFSGLK